MLEFLPEKFQAIVSESTSNANTSMQCMHLVLLLVPSVHAVPRLVISQDFPDPSVILVDRTWYAFATQHNDTSLVQMARSSDWNNWQTDPGDALGCLPACEAFDSCLFI